MAATHLSVDQYSCSLCKEVLREPVTIPCGHSYCMRCINDCWDQPDTEGNYSCPQCQNTFNVRPELNRNTILAELIEKLMEVTAHASPSQSYAGPGDVPCDVCPGRKRKASKTCLTCLASYCDTHLQPHFYCPAFKRHKIDEVTGKLEEKLCGKHQKVLEIFCRTDKTCICLLCAATEHKNHKTVTPDVERAGRQSHLEKRRSIIKNRISEKETTLKKMKEKLEGIQSSAESEVQKHEETFKSILESIERLRSKVNEVIREYEKKEVRKVEEIMECLKEEIEELKRRDAELVRLSQSDDHIHFLKKFPSLTVLPGGGAAPNINVNCNLLPENLRKDLSDLKKSLGVVKGWELVKTIKTEVEDSGHILQNLRSRSYLLKYSCPLTLDAKTKNNWLHLFARTTMVAHMETQTPFSDHPERFEFWPQVLCSEALGGTHHYWEVEWSGEEALIGVAYNAIQRSGESQESRLGFNDKSWCLSCSRSGYSVWHNSINTQISASYCQRIGVYLNCPAGSLSFYSVSDTMTLLHTFNAFFTEPLYPGFGVGKKSSVAICPLNPCVQ
ncbi:E3 ubiquitin/ISG15 ligase TRIM25-like [Polypterus senegalus]